MANKYFKNFNAKEAAVYRKLHDECCEIFGVTVWYIPRDQSITPDYLFGEDPISNFPVKYEMTMYVKSNTTFGGLSNMYTKFGFQEQAEVELLIEMGRFAIYATDAYGESIAKPVVGDLIYLPWCHHINEVMNVEDHNPFYQLGEAMLFEIKTQKWQYSYERVAPLEGSVTTIETEKTTSSDFEDNTKIDTEKTSILDFSEADPFGGT